jgi:GGDEF domain-containing protein
MGTIASLVRSLGQWRTYNLRRNPLLLIGLVLGCSAGLLSAGLAVATFRVGWGGDSRSIPYALVIPLLLAHPLLFGIIWGALGAVWRGQDSKLPHSAPPAASPRVAASAAGIHSPRFMMDHLRRAVARVAHSGEHVTILILEVEEAPEASALRSLAESIEPLLREGDILGFLGSHRLLLIVHGELPCSRCFIRTMADSVYDRCHLTLRAGVARWPEDGQAPAELLEAADLPLKASWRVDHSGLCPQNVYEPSSSQPSPP